MYRTVCLYLYLIQSDTPDKYKVFTVHIFWLRGHTPASRTTSTLRNTKVNLFEPDLKVYTG